MLKKNLYTVALLALSSSALAQERPTAGSQMQQIPPSPVPEKFQPRVDVVQHGIPATAEADTVKMLVKNLMVTGAKVYSEAELLALTGFTPGSELTLTELRGMATKISNHYRSNGYFVAQAYLPAQDIKNGVVTIAVIEGHYGKITLNNQTRLSDGLANDVFSGINSGDPIHAAPLESRLLLLSDIPGVKVKSSLVPGASVGASDLIVDLTPGPTVSGEVDFDNGGSRYTGEYRLGATVNLNNLAGRGDVASLRAMTSGSGLNYARASYQMQFGKATAGIAYSGLKYKLSRDAYENAGYNGTAEIASIYGSYPLIRSRNNNLNAGLIYEDKTFQDKQNSTSYLDKKAQVLSASLYGDSRDSFGGGGVNAYALTWSTGNIDIETPAARIIDAATAQTNGHFDKLGFRLRRLQRITDWLALSAAVDGQFASKNLDSSEKMQLGGMYGVRAYPEGKGYADEGYVLTLEARYLLPKYSETMPGRMHLIGFVDTGSVTINKRPWPGAAGDNTRTLSGAGVGINWTDPNNFVARAYYAVKLGNEKPTSAPDQSGRFWFQLVKYF